MSTPRSYALSELVDQSGFDRRTIVYYIQAGLLPKVGRRGPHTRYPDECLSRLLFIKGVRELQASGQLLSASLAEIGRALSALDAQGIRELLDRGLPRAEIEGLFVQPAVAEAPPASPAIATAPGPTPSANPPEPVPPPANPAPNPQPGGDRRSYGLADASIRQRFGTERPPAPPAAAPHEDTHPRLPVLKIPEGPAQAATMTATATLPPSTVSKPADAVPDDHADLGHLLRELELRPTLNPKRSPPGAPEQWTEIPITSRVYLSVRGLPENDAAIAEALARLLKRALRGRPSAV
ncbi:MAG: MerR family transcriptional regulator [Gammaproteobacteria bacterium]|nr:MerR family transcriptional regulator [Gammaproteobacteria bacterium]